MVVDDYPVLLASTADKIVALTSLLRRAQQAGNVTGFFATRGPLLRLLPYFHAYQQAAPQFSLQAWPLSSAPF